MSLRSSANPRHRGHGLGLSAVQRIGENCYAAEHQERVRGSGAPAAIGEVFCMVVAIGGGGAGRPATVAVERGLCGCCGGGG